MLLDEIIISKRFRLAQLALMVKKVGKEDLLLEIEKRDFLIQAGAF